MEKEDLKKKIREWIERLRESGKTIIVEGKKDKKVLEFFGVRGIKTLNKPLFGVVEDVAENNNEVIILTDFDKKGRELYGRLKKDLQKNGVKVDGYFREFLQRNTKLSHIEGLKTYAGNLE